MSEGRHKFYIRPFEVVTEGKVADAVGAKDILPLQCGPVDGILDAEPWVYL